MLCYRVGQNKRCRRF